MREYLHPDCPYPADAAYFGTPEAIDRAFTLLKSKPAEFATAGELFVTHVPTVSKHNSSDLLDDVNYEVFLEEMEDVDPDGKDHFDGSARHWAVGRLDSIAVRPFQPTEHGWETTEAWERAHELLEAMEDYPLLDEDRYSERIHERTYEAVTDAVGKVLAGPIIEWLYDNAYDPYEEDPYFDTEDLAEAAKDVIEPILAKVEARKRALKVGDGQLSLTGEVHRVPPPLTTEEQALLDEYKEYYGDL